MPTEATSHTAADPLALDVFVLPAFAAEDFRLDEQHEPGDSDVPNELQQWLDAYDFAHEIEVPGANAPVYYTESGIGITTTGMGKVEAATTVAALFGSSRLDCSETYFVTAGVAGAPPPVATLGAVFLADAVVDWDRKHRVGDDEGGSRVELLRYRPHDYVFRLDSDLVADALDVVEEVELADSEEAERLRKQYDDDGDGTNHDAASRAPFVSTGVTLCGDEFWHGREFSEQAQWLVEQYDAGTYATTEMEDFGTTTALERFGALDRYLSVRGVVNFDQPPEGSGARDGEEVVFELGLENTFRVASKIVDALAERE